MKRMEWKYKKKMKHEAKLRKRKAPNRTGIFIQLKNEESQTEIGRELTIDAEKTKDANRNKKRTK